MSNRLVPHPALKLKLPLSAPMPSPFHHVHAVSSFERLASAVVPEVTGMTLWDHVVRSLARSVDYVGALIQWCIDAVSRWFPASVAGLATVPIHALFGAKLTEESLLSTLPIHRIQSGFLHRLARSRKRGLAF